MCTQNTNYLHLCARTNAPQRLVSDMSISSVVKGGGAGIVEKEKIEY